MKTPTRSIRLPDEEVEAAMKKGATYNLFELTAIIRLALQKLSPAKKK